MAQLKKILVSLEEDLLEEVDEQVRKSSMNRSEFIREAMKLYLDERHKIEIREKMKTGYEQMAAINKDWAELCLDSDNKVLDAYETVLAESE